MCADSQDPPDPVEGFKGFEVYLIRWLVTWLDFRLSTATEIYNTFACGFDVRNERDCRHFVELIAREMDAGDPPA